MALAVPLHPLPASGRRPRVAIIDLVARKPIDTPYTRLMYPNFASIMPQAVAVWADAAGCEVEYLTYTGCEDVRRTLAERVDVVFICAFTQAAYLAYALASWFRGRGAVAILGGPHARSYASDARRYFDYVVGLADEALIRDLLTGAAPQRGRGMSLSAARPPRALPSVRQRWPFIQRNVAKSRYGAAVPMIGSLGCPYTCGFCIDAQFDYQPLPYDQIRDDLAFLRGVFARPIIGWHDPNFAVRFDDYLDLIAGAGAPGSIRFVAESSLSLLSRPHLERLRRHGCIGLIVGIESWFGFNAKTRQGAKVGHDKVAAVAEHVNLIARYIPYVQTNFVWGLDEDDGPLPFELNKRFVDLAPAAFPSHSVFTAYGNSAPLSRQLQQEGRMLDIPFQALDTASIHNVHLKHYEPADFYAGLRDVVRHSYSARATYRRLRHNAHALTGIPRWMNAVRSVSSHPRVRYYERMRHLFATDREFRAFGARDAGGSPRLFRTTARTELGPFYDLLPPPVREYLSGTRAMQDGDC